MSLRVTAASTTESLGGGEGDDWASRIAKLIPAEALGLYGAAVALVPADSGARTAALWIIVAVAAGLTVLVRWRSTQDPVTGKPQVSAIAIAIVSFFVWLLALGAPTSPIVLPADLAFAGPLAAFLWGTLVPYFYKGDA